MTNNFENAKLTYIDKNLSCAIKNNSSQTHWYLNKDVLLYHFETMQWELKKCMHL